ncbi:MAG: thiamine phosphate synthase [Campylobacterales bacterium]|nr:thiamine phosphate synthase [Campylobacterales bacterium]
MIRAYAITDPAYYGSTPELLCEVATRLIVSGSCDFLCYRDKRQPRYEAFAQALALTCKELGFARLLLHNEAALARSVGAFGVHLSSERSDRIEEAKGLGLFTVYSAHSEGDLKRAFDLGADACTYSPIFPTPHKGAPKGLEDLKEKTAKMGPKIIALGGITTPLHVRQVEEAGAFAFASIRYFVPFLEETHV